MNYYQIAILFLQGTLVAFLILLLFRMRKSLGLGLLFACLGMFQFMQVFLSSTVYVTIADNFLVSPGSSVLFTATLFAILLIYIKEDASETRKIVYALILINIIVSILLQSLSWNIAEESNYNPLSVSTNLFDSSALVLFIGTLVLFLDSLLIILIYEFVARHIRMLFLQICITMLIVISFDTIVFSSAAFWKFDNLKVIITSGLISKGIFTVFYSILFSIYLKYIETKDYSTNYFKIKDIFLTLSYKQKFEVAAHDAIKASEEIKLKEIKYKTLTDISPVGIFQTRSDGYTTFVNRRWSEISGMPQSEALGDGWYKAVHPADKQTIKDGWDNAVAKKSISETEYRFILSDGSIRWVLGLAAPELGSQNNIIGYVGTITDITDLKIYQQEQIKLREKAEESNLLKSAFLANMSHEIRTPMNGILGFVDLLKEPDITIDEQHTYVEIIRKSGARMLNILNDIISISKIEAGLVELDLKKLNINEQIEYIHNFFNPEVEEKGMQLVFKNALPLKEATIITDQEKLSSVLINLIKNAIKYSEKGKIEFGYTIKENFLEFYVKDSGIGIAKERLEAIFERFIQADIHDKMAKEGAGLGLSISRAFVEMLGGKLWVDSEKGKGSTFYFTIPYVLEKNKTQEITDKNSTEEKPNQDKKLKILIVEDDDTSLLLVKIILKKLNSESFYAKNGIEAVEFCKKHPDLDLILMDIKMPEMDGYEATRQIRKFNKKVIIFAQTAFAISGDDEIAIEAGCNEHLAKPIIKKELLALINQYFYKK